jgi:hypothetical protein
MRVQNVNCLTVTTETGKIIKCKSSIQLNGRRKTEQRGIPEISQRDMREKDWDILPFVDAFSNSPGLKRAQLQGTLLHY